MNKVHKVIWNRVKHCYVVVSEIAKNQGKDGKRNGSLLRGAVLAALLAGAFTMPAFGPAGDVFAAGDYGMAEKYQYAAFQWHKDDPSGNTQEITGTDNKKYTYNLQTVTIDKKEAKFWVRDGYTISTEAEAPRYEADGNPAIKDRIIVNKTNPSASSEGLINATAIGSSKVGNTIIGVDLNHTSADSFVGAVNSHNMASSTDSNTFIKVGEKWTNVHGQFDKYFKEVKYVATQGGYTFNGQLVSIEDIYAIKDAKTGDMKIGVFTTDDGKTLYTGSVYGKNNEILVTGVDKDGKYYSIWAADTTDPNLPLSLTVGQFDKAMKGLEEYSDRQHGDVVKNIEVTKATGDNANGGTISLSRWGYTDAAGVRHEGTVDGSLTITADGGTGGNDTAVHISNTNAEGQTVTMNLPTGSKVEANKTDVTIQNDPLKTLTINGETYTIQDKNDNDYVTSGTVSTKNGKTVLSLTRESGETIPDIDLSAIKGTTYSAGNGITISQDNKISAKVANNGNLTVDANGLALKKDIDLTNNGSLKVGGVTISKDTFDAGSKKIINVSAGVNDRDAVNVSQLNQATWTPKVNGTAVAPTADQSGKKFVNLKGSEHITVTATGAGEITFKDKDLAYTNLSNVTNITGTGKNAVTNIAKDAIKVVAGTNVTVDTKAGDANTPKTFTITAKDTTLSPNGVKKDTIANGYKYTVSDTANHTAVIDDVASAKKLGEINATLTGKLIKSGTIGTNGKITLQPNSGTAITLGGQLHDYAVTKGDIDANGNLNLLTTDSYGGGASKNVVISGIASRKYVQDTEDYVTSGQVNTNGTITLKRKLGQSMTISGLENYVTSKDTYVTEATYNNTTKKLTIKQNQGKKAIEISLGDITSGLSKTDYRLVKNPNATDGKYTVNSSGDVTLIIKDEASKNTETVKIGGIAVVYDKQGSLKSTNATVSLETSKKASTSIALGKGAVVSVDEGRKANGISFGNDTYTGGIAIGENTKAKNNSVTIGTNTYNGKIGDIDLSKYEKTTSQGVGTTTVGSNSYTWGTLATNMGTYNVTSTKYGQPGGTFYVAQNFGSTILGTMNSIESATSSSHVAGVANSIVGVANRTQNSNGSLIFGAGNEITNSIGTINGSPDGDSVTNAAESFRQSVKDHTGGGAVLAIGGGNKADYVQHSQLIGVNNTVTGTSEKNAEYVLVDGYNNTVTGSQNVTAIGSNNTVTGDSNKIYGDNHNVTGKNNVLIGSADTVTDTKASGAVILGHNANATVDGSVALGEGSIAFTDKGVVGYGYTGEAGKEDSTWKSTAAAVSVGGNGVTRQITNVAAGSADTDAVNVAQLKKVADVANAGWNISTDKPDGSSQTQKVAAGSTLKVTSSDSNLLADLDNADDGTVVMKVDLNKDITLKADDMSQFVSISGSKGTIWTSGNITVGTDPAKSIVLSAEDRTITGLSNTTWNGTTNDVSRAATEGQLQTVAETASKGWSLSTNGGTAQKVAPGDTVDFSNTDENVVISNDGTKVTVNLSENLTASSLTTGSAIMNGTGFGIVGEKGQPVYYITKDGLNANGQKITNVMAGTEDTDAVNVSQLEDVKSLASKHSTVTVNDKGEAANKNLILEESHNDNDSTNYDVKLADKVTLGTDAAKSVTIDGTEGVISIKDLKLGLQDYTYGAGDHQVTDQGGYFLTGLTNTKFNISNGGYKDYAGSSRAATEGQLYDAFSFLDNKIDNISIKGDGNVVVDPDGKGNGGTGEGGTTTPGTGTETSDPKPSPNWNIGLNNEKITLGNETNKVVIEGTKGNVTTTGTVSAGSTSISSDGLKVGDKTYVTKDGLDANDQKVTNVAAGDVSATSKDAVNGSQLYGVEQKVDNNSQNISILNGSLRNLDNRVNRVGAGAAALAALHPLDFDPDAKWDFSAGYGNYNGANAVSVGAFYRPNEDLMFSVGGSMGGGENMVNAGVSVKLGSGSSHVTTSKVAMAKEIKDLRQTVDAQAQQIAELAAMVRELTGKGTQTPTAGMFPDVPENHWAYEAVKDLKDRGYVAGYPDGTFKGDRTMTRYEFAQIVHNALQAGAPDSEAVKKLKAEFAPELERFTVDTIEQDKNGNPIIQRVRVVKKA